VPLTPGIRLIDARPARADAVRTLGGSDPTQRITILNGHARAYETRQPGGSFSLKWIPAGAARYRVDGVAHRLAGDALLLLNSGQPYEVEFLDRRGTESFCLFFADDVVRDAGVLPSLPDIVFHPAADLRAALDQLRRRFGDRDLSASRLDEVLLGVLDRLLVIGRGHGDLVERVPASRSSSRHRLAGLLLRAREQIDDVPGITLDALSTASGLSKFHLVRLFKAGFGTTPMRYAETRRIARAVPLLTAGRIGVAEAAAAVGYDSPSAFSRAFRRHHGLTPRQFRARARN
jgi:AraC-like DNA-binding protein